MQSKIGLRLALGALLAGGLWTAWTQQPDAPLELQKVVGDLHVLTGSGGNVGILVTSEGVILVDDKFDRNAPEIVAKVKTLTDKPIRYVLNTHHHGDHTGGNQPLQAQSVEIIAHENARASIVRNKQPGAPHISFEEQMTLHLGGQEVRALYFGAAHTNGDAVIYFPALRTVHTGDMFVRGAPFVDYANGGSALEWDDTLNSVLQLEFDTVIPGHGAVGTRDDLVQWKEDFETYRSRISDLSRAGKKPEDAATELKLDDIKGWSLGTAQMRSMVGLFNELR
jgi:glyoxylase-like metal-dependent hydrolase (beta-lactamase superfamily II)